MLVQANSSYEANNNTVHLTHLTTSYTLFYQYLLTF